MSIDTGRNAVVKVLEQAEVTPRPDLVGTWLDERHYHTLVESDMDLYLPPACSMEMAAEDNCDNDMQCGSCTKALNEKNIVFKFRKNYFSDEMVKSAYEGLRDAAQETQNRGTAAGPREGSLGNRQWVTSYEWDVLDAFKDNRANLMNEDPIDAIKAKYADNKADIPSNRAQVWSIERVRDTAFDFNTWVEETRKLSGEEQANEAEWVESDLICKTTYANSVLSGIAGWYDRYPRIPYGRATSYTEKNPEKFEMAYPFLQSLDRGFKELLPWRWNNQRMEADKLDPRFLVPDTVFTTITVNKSFRTACHRDAGDLDSGLSNLLVLGAGEYTGGYLVFPQVRIAVNVRPGDLLLVNNHEVIHGNTDITLNHDKAERISIVCYFREKMLELQSWEYEHLRKQYVEDRRMNKNHSLYRPLWNGVSPGMWEEQEWYDYLREKLGEAVLSKYHPNAMKASVADEFFV